MRLAKKRIIMKFLYIFPFLLISWMMLIFANDNYLHDDYAETVFYLFLASLFIYLAQRRYRFAHKKQYDIAHVIAMSVGLLPLFLSNLFSSLMTLQEEKLLDSGMVYVSVLIYFPSMYIITFVIIKIYLYLKRR